MKKISIIFLNLLLFFISNKTVRADHYRNFEDIEVINGKLIDEYENKELISYYKKVDKRTFSGWKIETINRRSKVRFISETLFSYYNDGTTPIDYNFTSEESETNKYNYSATGSIGLKLDKNKSGFKSGLNSSLKIDSKSDSTKIKKEKYEMKMKVDPQTQVNLYNYGEGYLTNGVAARYLFWIRTNRGGYEIFEMSTKYYRLEKIRIWKRFIHI